LRRCNDLRIDVSDLFHSDAELGLLLERDWFLPHVASHLSVLLPFCPLRRLFVQLCWMQGFLPRAAA